MKVLSVCSSQPLDFNGVYCNIFFFSLLILLTWVFFPFVNLAKVLSDLFIHSKDQIFLELVIFNLISLISSLILIISPCLLFGVFVLILFFKGHRGHYLVVYFSFDISTFLLGLPSLYPVDLNMLHFHILFYCS